MIMDKFLIETLETRRKSSYIFNVLKENKLKQNNSNLLTKNTVSGKISL